MCGRSFGNLLMPTLAGVLIGENVVQKQESPPQVSPATQAITCSACNTSVSPSFTWCPHCGQALKSHPCAYCGQVLEASDRNCPYCGAPSGIR
jgi:RNA polymerase subunit RPABC4/transcription elongation factor Spt4